MPFEHKYSCDSRFHQHCTSFQVLARQSGNLTWSSIASSLASYIDLTTLESLAKTCRQVRANLLQYRVMLMSKTLRCHNEDTSPGKRLGAALMASRDAWTTYGRHGVKVERITSGRVGACARDMVSDCRSCGRTLCRVRIAIQHVPFLWLLATDTDIRSRIV